MKYVGPMVCSVCIATFKRPELLEMLLTSIRKQILPQEVELEVIVVDNDSGGSAQEVVEKFQNGEGISFRYVKEDRKNISVARNVGVQESRGDYIVFIDDDEVAGEKWIASLLDAMREHDADGVFGPVRARVGEHGREWTDVCQFFGPPYCEIVTGALADYAWSGNCLVKASLLKGIKGPFDATYGITGGEDTHLFDRLRKQGAKLIYCNEAWVSEYFPPNRTKLRYVLRQGFKGGNIHTRRVIESATKGALYARIYMLVKSLSFGMMSLVLVIFLFPNVRWRTYWLMKLASNVGRFLSVFGYYYAAYS